VNEVFLTIQGEGMNAGRPAVFCRFSGCNLWSGKEKDRAKAICQFCDTNFRDADEYTRAELVDKIKETAGLCRFVVFTGGEPTMQLDNSLLKALGMDFEAAIETNGTLPSPFVDWICVSPKAGTHLRQKSGNELKLVYPQEGCEPEDFEDLEFEHFLLQPLDGPYTAYHTEAAAEYCMEHPRWRLSLQTHKFIGLP
jgi:7-carboxy-7-deazaguanine synthase (Cx14CxxC type)